MNNDDVKASLVKCNIPPHMHAAAIRYVADHAPVGDFLTAVICNNLRESFSRADDDNLAALHSWVRWFHWHAPSPCWGSPEKMAAWLKGDDNA